MSRPWALQADHANHQRARPGDRALRDATTRADRARAAHGREIDLAELHLRRGGDLGFGRGKIGSRSPGYGRQIVEPRRGRFRDRTRRRRSSRPDCRELDLAERLGGRTRWRSGSRRRQIRLRCCGRRQIDFTRDFRRFRLARVAGRSAALASPVLRASLPARQSNT